jgi:hypothetical protein
MKEAKWIYRELTIDAGGYGSGLKAGTTPKVLLEPGRPRR